MKVIKNIALVFFPINDVGGIITWNKEIQKGFKKLGVTTMYFYATAGNKYNCDPDQDVKKERYTQLAGYHLSFSNEHIKESIEILNQFDAIIFTKNSPHPTQDNLKYKCIENWKLLYSETKPPKIVVFHDELWEKTNKWSADVAEYISICIAAQKRFIHSVKRFPVDCIKYWDYFPVDLSSVKKLDLNNKKEFGMVATQWVKWKNHHKFLPLLPMIQLPIFIFGAGMEWHYLKKTPEYQEAIGADLKMSNINIFDEKALPQAEVENALRLWDKGLFSDLTEELVEQTIVHNEQSPHVMFGHIEYKHLQQVFAKAKLSIDLSTRGYTNYTHFEPLCYRTLSFIERRVANDPDNIIPHDCCVIYDFENLPAEINKYKGIVASSGMDKIRSRGQLFVQNMDCVKVATRIIDKLEQL